MRRPFLSCLPTIIDVMEGFGIIDSYIHSLMGEVSKERNEIVHKLLLPMQLTKTKQRKLSKKQLKVLGIT